MNYQTIKKAIRSRMFWSLVFNKLHSFVPLYVIRNRNIRFQNKICKSYYKCAKKYRRIIEEGVSCSEFSQKSDKIWICWFQGEENAPDLVKACIESVRRSMPEKDIVVLTDMNIEQYTDFPEYIIKKRQQGIISAAHFSDLLRVELLCRHGGMWIDSTVLCTADGTPQYIKDSDFFVYKQLNTINLDEDPIVCSSWLISSVSNQKILLLTRKLLWTYWKKAKRVENYFLFHIFLSLSARRYGELWEEVPFYNNHCPHELFRELEKEYTEKKWQRIVEKSDFHKLSHHITFSTEKRTIYNHIIDKYSSR